MFAIVCVFLGWLGAQPAEGIYVVLARIAMAYYFAYFIIILPVLGLVERTKPLPASISESVLGKKSGGGAQPAGSTAAPQDKG